LFFVTTDYSFFLVALLGDCYSLDFYFSFRPLFCPQKPLRLLRVWVAVAIRSFLFQPAFLESLADVFANLSAGWFGIVLITPAQISSALLVIAFLLLYLAFYKRPQGTASRKGTVTRKR